MEEQTELNEGTLPLDTLEYKRFGGPSDAELDKLDGCRAKIASVERVLGRSIWENGQKLPDGQEIEVEQIKLTTVPFGKNLIERDITHSEKYNLKFTDGNWVVSLFEKAHTAQFLAKYKCPSP